MNNEQIQKELEIINFPIQIQTIAGIPEEMGRKIVRLDHAPATPLGIVGSRYQPINHMEAFGGAIKSMELGGLDFTDAKLDVSSYENGAMAKMDASNKKITNAVNAVTSATGAFQRWWDTKVEDDAVSNMFEKTIAKMPLSQGAKMVAKSETNKKQLYILMGLYNEEVKQLHGSGDYGRKEAKGSLWCAYQASTAWSTHLSDITIRERQETHSSVSKTK